MKTVIEIRSNRDIYVYQNTEKHFKKIKDKIPGIKKSQEQSAIECLCDKNTTIIIDGPILSRQQLLKLY